MEASYPTMSADFNQNQEYLIMNPHTGRYIQRFNDSFMGLGADGVRCTAHKHEASSWIIKPEGGNNIKNYPDSLRVSICNNGYYINRWHGGDSNGAELGMYKECDGNSIWRMHF